MKKVIPKKKNAFLNKYNSMHLIEIDNFQSISPSVSSSLSYTVGMAKEKIKAGDLLVLDKDGKIGRFTGSEGRKYV